MGSAEDRRRHPRVDIRAEMQAGVDEEPFAIHLLDLSESGARFTCQHELTLNVSISINIDFYPVGFPIRSLILWRRKMDDSGLYVYGCEFINPTPGEAFLIRELVRTALKQSPS